MDNQRITDENRKKEDKSRVDLLLEQLPHVLLKNNIVSTVQWLDKYLSQYSWADGYRTNEITSQLKEAGFIKDEFVEQEKLLKRDREAHGRFIVGQFISGLEPKGFLMAPGSLGDNIEWFYTDQKEDLLKSNKLSAAERIVAEKVFNSMDEARNEVELVQQEGNRYIYQIPYAASKTIRDIAYSFYDDSWEMLDIAKNPENSEEEIIKFTVKSLERTGNKLREVLPTIQKERNRFEVDLSKKVEDAISSLSEISQELAAGKRYWDLGKSTFERYK